MQRIYYCTTRCIYPDALIAISLHSYPADGMGRTEARQGGRGIPRWKERRAAGIERDGRVGGWVIGRLVGERQGEKTRERGQRMTRVTEGKGPTENSIPWSIMQPVCRITAGTRFRFAPMKGLLCVYPA